jgi:hypothetical protein
LPEADTPSPAALYRSAASPTRGRGSIARRGFELWRAMRNLAPNVPHRCHCLRLLWCVVLHPSTPVPMSAPVCRFEMSGASSRKSKSKGASSSPNACRFVSFSPDADLPPRPVAAESGHGAIPVLFMFGAPVGAHGPLPWRPAHVIASSTESEGQQPSSICQQKAVHSIPVCKLQKISADWMIMYLHSRIIFASSSMPRLGPRHSCIYVLKLSS